MQRFTKIFFLRGTLVLSVVFLLASFAQASGSHHSHHHQAKVVSPFDKVSADKPLHCLLNAHRHQIKQDCPHKENHSKSVEFRTDCGSHPGASHQKGFSFGSDLSQVTQDEFIHHLASHSFYLLIDTEVCLLPRSIEHPPQLS